MQRRVKEESWISLTNKFNSKSSQIPRQIGQLKLKWDNLKKAARKRAAAVRMNNLKTGGGKPDYIPPDEILEKVRSSRSFWNPHVVGLKFHSVVMKWVPRKMSSLNWTMLMIGRKFKSNLTQMMHQLTSRMNHFCQ
ncbi:unnamed protein product [Spodoptera littoralis]|uniref:Regulatory protein zeste n=1 Tax=Spodoptera littoralis TaxID=7109 RepID=A0A9P0N6D0_SPOLI|nr:unnamed protein product [Spodoptera littoralis]CAH1643159.1 unnamed protein product [Spodoptera littoralis]